MPEMSNRIEICANFYNQPVSGRGRKFFCETGP
jgi:hypothetical protein